MLALAIFYATITGATGPRRRALSLGPRAGRIKRHCRPRALRRINA
jgi:hypothetical protein